MPIDPTLGLSVASEARNRDHDLAVEVSGPVQTYRHAIHAR